MSSKRIASIRRRVDSYDDQLLKTLAGRRKAVLALIEAKADADRPIRDLGREEKLLSRVIKAAAAERAGESA